jgi:hypothetical protein
MRYIVALLASLVLFTGMFAHFRAAPPVHRVFWVILGVAAWLLALLGGFLIDHFYGPPPAREPCPQYLKDLGVCSNNHPGGFVEGGPQTDAEPPA